MNHDIKSFFYHDLVNNTTTMQRAAKISIKSWLMAYLLMCPAENEALTW